MRCPYCSERVPMLDATHHGEAGVVSRRLCRKFVTFRKYTGCRGTFQYVFSTPDGERFGDGADAAQAFEASTSVLNPPSADKTWGHVGPQCQALVERLLAAQGDHAEPELVQLQHDLVELNTRDIPF